MNENQNSNFKKTQKATMQKNNNSKKRIYKKRISPNESSICTAGKQEVFKQKRTKLDKFNRHTSHFYVLFRFSYNKFDLIEYSLFPKFAFNKTDSKFCCVYRNIDFFKKICKTSYMVFMTVCYDNASKKIEKHP